MQVDLRVAQKPTYYPLSFLRRLESMRFSDDPHDLDIAVFQNSDESCYPLAMKYRRTLRLVGVIKSFQVG